MSNAVSLKRTSFLLALLLLLGVASCATYKPGRIEVHPVDEYPQLSTVEGLSVAVDPYPSMEKAKQGFYVDVTRKGFLPVNLIFRNHTEERVRVRRETIELTDENGVVYKPVSAKVMYARFKKNLVTRFLAGSVISVAVGVVAAVSALLANRKMKADWRQKEIPDQLIIQPGRQMNGFVYFKVPEGTTTTVSKLHLESERLESGEKVRFELTPGENPPGITLSPIKRRKPVEPSHTGPNR